MDQLNLVEVKNPSSQGNEGYVTQVFEATGLGEIADALPGAAAKKFDGTLNFDTVLGKGAEGIGTTLALLVPNPFLQTLTYTGKDEYFTSFTNISICHSPTPE